MTTYVHFEPEDGWATKIDSLEPRMKGQAVELYAQIRAKALEKDKLTAVLARGSNPFGLAREDHFEMGIGMGRQEILDLIGVPGRDGKLRLRWEDAFLLCLLEDMGFIHFFRGKDLHVIFLTDYTDGLSDDKAVSDRINQFIARDPWMIAIDKHPFPVYMLGCDGSWEEANGGIEE